MDIEVVVLAAGQGKRMYSQLPKILHPLAGIPMIERVLQTAELLKPKQIHLVYGHQAERIHQQLSEYPINWVMQNKQLGTGHALQQVLPHLARDSQVLILCGDVPLISHETLSKLISTQTANALSILTADFVNPSGLGRIIRDHNHQIIAIIEEKDASPSQKQINEIYTGIMLASRQLLAQYLPTLANNNAQGELYLTDILAKAVENKVNINSVTTDNQYEVTGVNNRLQLSELERHYHYLKAKQLLLSGIAVADPRRIDIRGNLFCENEVTIDINTIFEGKVSLGEGCHIGPNCQLKNVTVGRNVVIKANSIIEESEINDNCIIGPFAHIRPGTKLAQGAKVGNFVEIKKSELGIQSKVNHLSYIGDAFIGNHVNVGAGTITCNYDGANKHKTTIENDAFIGSGTQLIAPVTVGEHATIGAGSTIRKDVPANHLCVTQAKQMIIDNWQRPQKKPN